MTEYVICINLSLKSFSIKKINPKDKGKIKKIQEKRHHIKNRKLKMFVLQKNSIINKSLCHQKNGVLFNNDIYQLYILKDHLLSVVKK